MEGYNSKQKLYIFIAIAIFIVLNLLALVFALPYFNKGSVKGIYTDNINASTLISGNLEKPVQLETNKELATNSDSLYIKNLNYSLFALPQSRLNIRDLNVLSLDFGVYYLETYSDLTITKNFDIKVTADSRIILDSEEGNLYILKGDIAILGINYPAGFVINVNSKTLSGDLLNKAQLLSTNKVKEMNKLLAAKSLFIPELNFLSKPLLEIKDNLFEITTDTPSYLISGKVSPLSHVYIDSTEVKVNEDGAFELRVILKNGLNNYQINVVDEVVNTLSSNIKIILNN